MSLAILICFLPAFFLSLLLTPLAGRLGRRAGILSSSEPTNAVPITGGAAIVLSAAAGVLVCTRVFPNAVVLHPGLTLGAAAAALLGFVDDVRPLRPWQKLAGQLLAAGLAVGLGFTISLTGDPTVNTAVTLAWLVWASNAFNVTDMMDGLAAGLGLVTALGAAWIGLEFSDAGVTTAGLATAGALAGFMIYNAAPARLYMGDSGSLPVGMLLGGLVATPLNSAGGWSHVAVPPLLLGVVMFEGMFLVVMRTARGVPVMQASPDHTAARLRLMGLSTREAVALLWLVQAAFVVLAMCLPGVPGVSGLVLAAVGMLAAGGFLATVDVRLDAAGVAARGRAWFSRNWLVHRLLWDTMADKATSASGRLLDLGCGRQPYRTLFEPSADAIVGTDRDRGRYVGVDTGPDVLSNAEHLPFRDGVFGTVLSNQMLEHVRRPQRVVCEAARVLRPGGRLILTAPHIWSVHEVPDDYYRFTPYGLRHLAEEAGLVVEDVRAMAGFWVTAGARFAYYLARFGKGPLSLPVKLALLPIQMAAWMLDRVHRVEADAWNHVLVARKEGEER